MRDEPCIKIGPPLPFFPDSRAEIEELRNRLALMSLALEQIANDIKEDIFHGEYLRSRGRRVPLEDTVARMEERYDRLINEASTLKAEGQKNNTNGWKK